MKILHFPLEEVSLALNFAVLVLQLLTVVLLRPQFFLAFEHILLKLLNLGFQLLLLKCEVLSLALPLADDCLYLLLAVLLQLFDLFAVLFGQVLYFSVEPVNLLLLTVLLELGFAATRFELCLQTAHLRVQLLNAFILLSDDTLLLAESLLQRLVLSLLL